MRAAKASIHLHKVGQARGFLSRSPASPDKAIIERAIRHVRDARLPEESAKAELSKILQELPRYKPVLQQALEYYTVGHDTPESMFDESLLQTGRQKIALLFAGIGDARNLYNTLLTAAEDPPLESHNKSFHFTIVDIKSAAVARDLVTLLMFNELADHLWRDAKEAGRMSICLYYTFIAPTMPNAVYDTLQSKIQEAIDALEGRRALPDFLDVPEMYRSSLLITLRSWQTKTEEEFPASKVRRSVLSGRMRD